MVWARQRSPTVLGVSVPWVCTVWECVPACGCVGVWVGARGRHGGKELRSWSKLCSCVTLGEGWGKAWPVEKRAGGVRAEGNRAAWWVRGRVRGKKTETRETEGVDMEGKWAGEAEGGDSPVRRGKIDTGKTEAGKGDKVGDGTESSRRGRGGKGRGGECWGARGSREGLGRSSARSVDPEC